MRVLFVCSGNICRSPMAEALFRKACDGAPGLAHVAVDSAGTLGLVGRPASPEAVRALAERGLDLRGHRSRALDAERLRAADVTLAMTWDHLEELARRFPDAGGERYLLRAFERGVEPSGDPADLEDPIGEPIDVYRAQLPILDACVGNLALWVKHRA